MTRLLLVWLLSFLFAATSVASSYARGAVVTDDAADPVDRAFDVGGYGAGAIKDYFGVLEDQRWDAAADAFVSHDQTVADLTEAIKVAQKAEGWKNFFDRAGKVLTGIELAWHALQGEWLEASKTAAGAIADLASGVLLQSSIGALAVYVCGAAIVGTVGLATPVCIAGMVVVAHFARSVIVTEGTKAIVGWAGQSLICRYRPRSDKCDIVPGEPVGGLAWRPISPEDVWGGAGPPLDNLPGRSGPATARVGQIGAKPGGGMGSSRITAVAEDVTTVATRGATAVTEIGVSDPGGGRLAVEAEDITTIAAGRDARTTIGSGAGVVSVQGGVINEGGVLEIGASGISRDGATCVEVYRETCIVHFYYRRKKDPCLPGYWMEGRKCRLPSDRQHKIK